MRLSFGLCFVVLFLHPRSGCAAVRILIYSCVYFHLVYLCGLSVFWPIIVAVFVAWFSLFELLFIYLFLLCELFKFYV